MKTKTFLSFFLVGLCLVFASCQNQSERVVPKKALAVLKIDFKSLAVKASLDESQKDKIYKLARHEDKDFGEQVEKMLNDPLSTGLDLIKPVYVFMAEMDWENEPGVFVSMGVKNEEKFSEYMKDLNKELVVKHKEDYSLIYLDDDLIGAFDGKVAIIGNFNNDAKVADQMLHQKKEDSYFETEQGKNLTQMQGEMTLYADFENLNLKDLNDRKLKNFMSEFMGDLAYEYAGMDELVEKVSELELGMALHFEDAGVISLKSQVFKGGAEDLSTQKISTQMLEYIPSKNLQGVILGAVDGKLIAKSIEKVMKFNHQAAARVEEVAVEDPYDYAYDYEDELGDVIYDEYEAYNRYDEYDYFNMFMDVLRHMDGTVVCAVNGTNEDNISATVILPIKEQNLSNAFGDMYEEIVDEMQHEGAEIGEKEGTTFVVYNRDMKKAAESALDNAKVADAEGCFAYMYYDIPKMLKLYENLDNATLPGRVKRMFSSFEMKVPSMNECSLILSLDTEDNSLAFLIDELLDMAD